MIITRINSLIEALQDDRPLNRVLIAQERQDRRIGQIRELCRQRGVLCSEVPRAALDRKAGHDHQGVWAEMAPVAFHDVGEIAAAARHGLLLALDGIEDAGNLGAILRSAAAAGVDGVLLSARRCAPINETVAKTAMGCLGKVPLARPLQLAHELQELKKQGWWIIGAAAQADQLYHQFDFGRTPVVLVMGSEATGISGGIRRALDTTVTIPLATGVESLNVAAATAVLLFEAVRQKQSHTPNHHEKKQ